MIQHPIPQNVTGYQFHLIGDMTIKQFIFLSSGIAAAIFFFYTNLFAPIKWILVISSAMSGFAIAFLPFEERPLDQWILNYIRAIYRETRYAWKKTPPTPDYFTFIQDSRTIIPADQEQVFNQATLRREQGLRSFLVTLPDDITAEDSLEATHLSQITNLFSTQSSLPTPNLSLNISPSAPPPQDSPEPLSDNTLAPTHIQTGSSGVISLNPVSIEKTITLEADSELQPISYDSTNDTQSSTLTPRNLSEAGPVVAATTTTNLPFPSTPSTPNTVVGMVLDASDKIIDNAIVEVLDESGLPVRATKTNQLGQFFSTTPLKRGTYRLTVEKAGFTFDTIELNLIGSIVPPLKIQAKPSI